MTSEPQGIVVTVAHAIEPREARCLVCGRRFAVQVDSAVPVVVALGKMIGTLCLWCKWDAHRGVLNPANDTSNYEATS